ncbi:helix-turn-helix domain-containing protein [Paenalkalicoccus suaedae]|uniref:Helix-turn-helix domain-containing protein n=1 Tax=Paenalkalicoccus suaedae TaxID=2592382 RepID=A0A859FF98_9BACI|nr:helix-turn-helix domain-containing protein [Paenalkalicoccus suaedae]QKS71372.1 helix-turn-helix domain-containing protein [Paenalkalicoccus suaedae]
MSELGIRLKTAREEKGYSHEELQRITKIQKRYLVAIEEGDYSKMPGDFYARAFVKSYAEAVGLSPEMVFNEHADELPKPKKQESAELPPRTRAKPKQVRKKSSFQTLLPSIVVVLFILAVGLILYISFLDNDDQVASNADVATNNGQVEVDGEAVNNEPEETNANSTTTGNDEPANEEPDAGEVNNVNNNEEEPLEETEQELAFSSQDGIRSTYSLSNAEELNITMTFSGGSWLQILDSNDDVVHEQTHDSGDEISFDFSGEEAITFNMGNVTTATIFVNEEELSYESDAIRQYVIIENEQ